jgi:hypothetical protein
MQPNAFTTNSQNLVSAHKAGILAYTQGKALQDNPYPVAATNYTNGGLAWQTGWRSAWYKEGAPKRRAPNHVDSPEVITARTDHICDLLSEMDWGTTQPRNISIVGIKRL